MSDPAPFSHRSESLPGRLNTILYLCRLPTHSIILFLLSNEIMDVKGSTVLKKVYKYEFFVVVVVSIPNNFPSSIYCGEMLALPAVKVPRFILCFKQA